MKTRSSQPVAHAYVRISHPDQRKGGGLERQQSNDLKGFCRLYGFTLAKRNLVDDGVSAFKGLNATPDHELGKFLAEARRGLIPAGDCLLIENYDRLSRQDPWSAIGLVSELRSLKIHVGRLDRMKLLRYDSEDTGDFFEAAVEFMRGNSESRVKSVRNGKAWNRKRKAAKDKGTTITNCLPAWIRHVDGKREAIPEYVDIIRRIFHLTANGYGHALIVKKFKSEGVKSFGEGNRKSEQNKKEKTWARSYIARILSDERVLGHFQPRHLDGSPAGDVIRNYYPAIITEEEWNAAQGSADQRKVKRWKNEGEGGGLVTLYGSGLTVNQIARRLGIRRPYVRQRLVRLGLLPPPKKQEKSNYVNVFARLLRNALGGDSYYCATRTDSGKYTRVLINTDAAEGRTAMRSFPFATFEQAILSMLREVDPHELLNGDAPDESLILAGELAKVEAELSEAKAFMDAKGFNALIGERIMDLTAKQKDVSERLAVARQKALHPLSESWGECKTILDALNSAPDPEEARLRLQSILRRIIKQIWLLVVPGGRDRLAFVQVDFHGSNQPHREYWIFHRPPKANGRGRTEGYWQVKSWRADEFPALRAMPVDLADPGCVNMMAGSMEAMMDETEKMFSREVFMEGERLIVRPCPKHPLP
jgi:DNA invertase Pin-like site-specific DNA recombinase